MSIIITPNLYQFKPFPLGLLPEPVKSFVKESARAIGCDPSLIALPTLAILASCVGNTRRIRLKRTWAEPCIIWTVIVGKSGSHKSPSLRLALASLHQIQNEMMKDHKSQMDQYEREMEDYNPKKRTKSQADEMQYEKPQKPQLNRIIVSDATVEAMAPILATNPRGVLLASDELSTWFGGFNAYRQGKGNDAAKWIEMFYSQPLTIDRKTSDSVIHIPHAAVSITGGIQPGILQRVLSREHFENGLVARLLLAMPPTLPKRWTENELSLETDDKMNGLVNQLFSLDFDYSLGDEFRPIDIPLSDKAKIGWVNFSNKHNEQLAVMSCDLAAMWTKLEAYCARFALLIHLIRSVMNDPTLVDHKAIDIQSVAVAEQLVRWFGNEAQRVYAVMAENEEQSQFRELVELVQAKGGSISVRELSRSNGYRDKPGQAKEDLIALEYFGYGKLEYKVPSDKGGHPTEVFTLHDQYQRTKTSDFSKPTGVMSQ